MSAVRLIVVHGLYRYHVHWATATARELGVPYWVVPHGALDPYVFTYRSLQKRAWLSLAGKAALRGAHRVLFATPREREKAAPYLDKCVTEIIPLPIAAAHPLSQEARSVARARLGIPHSARVLLFLGRLHPMKRVLETIDVIHQADHPKVHLIIVGPGSEELSLERCQQYVDQLRCGRVHVIGPAFGAEKVPWVAASDCFISLSHRENFGYAAAESLALGLPVILSPENDLALQLAKVRAGWLLASLSISESIKTVREFGDAPNEALRAMGLAGAAWVREELSTTRFALRLRALAAAVGNV